MWYPLPNWSIPYRNNFDDTQDAILKRIETYNSKTKPVAQKHNAKVINASGASDAVFAELEKIVATLL